MNHLGKMKTSTVLEKHTHEHICKATENITECPQDLCVLFGNFQVKGLENIFQPSLEGGIKRKNSPPGQSMM